MEIFTGKQNIFYIPFFFHMHGSKKTNHNNALHRTGTARVVILFVRMLQRVCVWDLKVASRYLGVSAKHNGCDESVVCGHRYIDIYTVVPAKNTSVCTSGNNIRSVCDHHYTDIYTVVPAKNTSVCTSGNNIRSVCVQCYWYLCTLLCLQKTHLSVKVLLQTTLDLQSCEPFIRL